jgi:DNA-binding Lrp family transcriptional regulator
VTDLDARIVAALRDAGDDQTAVDLAEATKATYPAVLRSLDRLNAAGTIERSKSRVGAWRLVDDHNPGAAA